MKEKIKGKNLLYEEDLKTINKFLNDIIPA